MLALCCLCVTVRPSTTLKSKGWAKAAEGAKCLKLGRIVIQDQSWTDGAAG